MELKDCKILPESILTHDGLVKSRLMSFRGAQRREIFQLFRRFLATLEMTKWQFSDFLPMHQV